MRILILSLPGIGEYEESFFPLGPAYLIAGMGKGHMAKASHFNDLGQAREEVGKGLKIFRPDIAGFTCNTFNRGFVREAIKEVRRLDRHIRIVVGGIHASFCYRQLLEDYGADIVVIGEGEHAFSGLCDALEDGRGLEGIGGIAYKENSRIRLNPPGSLINDLDSLPFPDYSYAESFMEQSRTGFLITSRGCPVRCTFCSTSSFWGQKIRMYSPKRVVDEMQMLIDRFGVKKIFFHDDTFNLSIERVRAICQEIVARKVRVDWGCSCRVAPVSREMVSAMVNAGCRHICWGVESGSEYMLRKINKKIGLEQVRNAFEISKEFSRVMSTGAFTMVGNPGETEETVEQTRRFLNTIPLTDHPSTSILCVLPGTALYEELKKERYISEGDWVKHDSVPLYTLDNSYRTLYRWRNIVQNSGKRIPFEPRRHFWFSLSATSDLNRYTDRSLKVRKVAGCILHPRRSYLKYFGYIKKLRLRAGLYLLNVKGRLSW